MTKADAAILADKVLKTYWLPNDFPIDPAFIANKLGVKVSEVELPETFSGALTKKRDKDPYIIIRKDDHMNRKRFSCAHEIGHYVARVETNTLEAEYDYVDLRSDFSSIGKDEDEIFANEFAANLLMPANAVKQLYKQDMSIIAMSRFFEVSNEAMSHRLTNLGLAR
ncbi:MAG: ImmA/IrrE family metallo-endopeptidase [Campylobacteraceae bacterium]|nr:ImmA/IrrE family metallo-endopeptidase [Campylobacteraceae bacterium]